MGGTQEEMDNVCRVFGKEVSYTDSWILNQSVTVPVTLDKFHLISESTQAYTNEDASFPWHENRRRIRK